MTKQQYENLKLGDLVTKYAGPNKGKIMKVVKKYFGFDGLPCLKAKGVDENIYIFITKIKSSAMVSIHVAQQVVLRC